MQIKKKLSSVVDHVHNNRGTYAWVAGCTFGVTIATATIIVMLKNDRFVNLSKALEHIQRDELAGLYYMLDDVTMLLHIAPEDFDPNLAH